MTVGALVDAGAGWQDIEAALRSLNLNASFRVEKTIRHGIAASKFFVTADHESTHRHLFDIDEIIRSGELSEAAQNNALAVFRRLADAEAKCHDLSIEKVHFHEVGAVDSICDIVAACVALDLLSVDEVRSSAINVGSGTIKAEHGLLPVPAPATAALLRDRPIYSAGPEAELTTPTGAALLTTLATEFGALPPMRLVAQGFGAGDKDFPSQANVLRVLLGEQAYASESISVSILEANIDDSTPQVLGYALERLLQAGALDVTLTPIFMKKNRPATMLSVLAPPELRDRLASILFAETTTLGIRIVHAERRVLSRHTADVQTPYGTIRIKYTDTGNFAPEYEDCRKAAAAKGVPLRIVIAEANQAFSKHLHESG